jgi:outer membrane autotransporter protein
MRAGVMDASGGSFELTGNLSNDGRTTMQDGAVGGTITVSGDYEGMGILLVDTDFTSDASDKLVVGGDITGGTTQIMVADVSTGAASGNDVVVVDVAGSTAAGDFALAGGPITSGVFDYDLELADRQWVLAGALNPTGAVYEALPLVLGGFNQLPTLEQRVHQRSSTEGQPLWLRLTGNRLNATPSSMSGLSYDSDQWGLQAGADVALEPGAAGQWVIGATVQYGQISAGVQNALGAGSIDAEGYGVGATATYYGNAGVYVDLQGQMNWITSDIASSVSGDLATDRDSRAYAVSAEVGQSIALSQGGSLIPQAQLTWGRVKGDSFTDAAGNAVVPGDNESLVGRLGLAYQSNETESGQFHVIGNLLHDFSGAQTTQANATGLSAAGANTWAEFGIGGHVELAPNQLLYGEASYRSSLNGGGNSALSLSVGFRMDF